MNWRNKVNKQAEDLSLAPTPREDYPPVVKLIEDPLASEVNEDLCPDCDIPYEEITGMTPFCVHCGREYGDE